MQTLFEWDFHSGRRDPNDIFERVIREFAPGIENKEFARGLLAGVLGKRKKIDQIIEKTAPEWPISKIALVDRNVLRLGLYELIFGDRKEVPAKVAINEAIELAKMFGGSNSGKFANGVLGTVYKEMIAAAGGKEETGSEGSNRENLEQNATQRGKLTEETLGGGVVYFREGDEIAYALVHDVFGFWTLSKGSLKKNEDPKMGTARELKKELGIDVEVDGELGTNQYLASHPEKGKIKKTVVYFLAEAKDKRLKLAETGGLDDVRWFREEELEDLKIYDDLKPIIVKAIAQLKKNEKSVGTRKET
jgi:N utilization substance protein B